MKDGQIIGTMPLYLQKELYEAKKKHFKSMEHFLRRRMKKIFKGQNIEIPIIRVRPEIVLINPKP